MGGTFKTEKNKGLSSQHSPIAQFMPVNFVVATRIYSFKGGLDKFKEENSISGYEPFIPSFSMNRQLTQLLLVWKGYIYTHSWIRHYKFFCLFCFQFSSAGNNGGGGGGVWTKVHWRVTNYCYGISRITKNRLPKLCIEEQFKTGLSSMYICEDSQSSLRECIYIRALCSKSSFKYKMLWGNLT